MSENTEIRDDAALWHESRNVEIQDFEEPAFIEPELESDPDLDQREHISDRDVKTELNMLKLNEPTAEIIISLMDYLMIIPMSFICRGITREETRVEQEEREQLVMACANYLKTTSFNLSPGFLFLTTVLTIYGAKAATFHFTKQMEPEEKFIKYDEQKENGTIPDSGSERNG